MTLEAADGDRTNRVITPPSFPSFPSFAIHHPPRGGKDTIVVRGDHWKLQPAGQDGGGGGGHGKKGKNTKIEPC